MEALMTDTILVICALLAFIITLVYAVQALRK